MYLWCSLGELRWLEILKVSNDPLRAAILGRINNVMAEKLPIFQASSKE